MNMDNLSSTMMWRVTWVFAVILVLVVVTLSVRSITRALRGTEQAENVTAPPQSEKKDIPSPAPSSPMSYQPTRPSDTQPSPSAKLFPPQIPPSQPKRAYDDEFLTDFNLIVQREEAQKETIKTLRQYAEENPDAENAPSKEEIDKLEKAGSLIE